MTYVLGTLEGERRVNGRAKEKTMNERDRELVIEALWLWGKIHPKTNERCAAIVEQVRALGDAIAEGKTGASPEQIEAAAKRCVAHYHGPEAWDAMAAGERAKRIHDVGYVARFLAPPTDRIISVEDSLP